MTDELGRRRGKSGSLVVIGAGYKMAARITPEATDQIARADIVFYLAYDEMDELWLRRLQPNGISLANCCKPDRPTRICCQTMVQTIMRSVRKGQAVCVAFPGHPSICVDPTRAALTRARAEGFPTRMIPGISAVDCLFADLCLDPTTISCRIFDAARFVLRKHPVDRSSGLILLQVANIGCQTHKREDIPERKALRALEDVLARCYGRAHKIIHYQAATSPIADPLIEEVAICDIHKCDIRFKSTLYVPPKGKSNGGGMARPSGNDY